jgi:putative addiction module killer protein
MACATRRRRRSSACASTASVWEIGDSRPVGEGVMEARIDFGPGYRVYFARNGEALVILLCGGDKSTQDPDIRRAKEYWSDYRTRE